jgi:transposase InsO family protein
MGYSPNKGKLKKVNSPYDLYLCQCDNGLVFTSSQFKTFYTYLGIAHHTGIPKNTQGQGILEKIHQTLKAHLVKQKTTTNPPSVQLIISLSTLNIFNIYKTYKHPPISLH